MSEAVSHATEIKLRAERKAGEILKFTKKNEGSRPMDEKTSADVEPVSAMPTLAEIGVTKKENSRFQKLATSGIAEVLRTLLRSTKEPFLTSLNNSDFPNDVVECRWI